MKYSVYINIKNAFSMKKILLSFLICLLGLQTMGQDVDTLPYFRTDSLPDAGIYLPAPPDTCSPLFIDDFQQWLWGKSMRSTPRGQQASWESLYGVPRMCTVFSEALGFTITAAGKHYKVTYYGDDRYQTAISATPSDSRAGANMASIINNMCN